MQKLNVNTLMFEMTRQCTMMCLHCLRGDAEDMTISVDTAKKVLSQCEYIGTVTFSGGEPFLEADKIIEILDFIMSEKISCNGIYIATNGSVFNAQLMQKICEFIVYCNPYINMNYLEDELISYRIDISKTPYHDNGLQTNDAKFSMYRFVSQRKDCDDENYLIPEGRAYINGYGQLNRTPRNNKSVPKGFDITDNNITMLYVNCNGEMFPDCDLSYTTQADWVLDTNETIPNINRNDDIYTQIEKYNEYIEENIS